MRLNMFALLIPFDLSIDIKGSSVADEDVKDG